MEKNKKQQKDYSTYKKNYQVKIDIELEIMIPSNESVRLLYEVMEELDYTNLYRAYSRFGRKPKTSPKTMYQLLIYGATEGKFECTEVARACKRDINYMWILGGEPAPNDDALIRFRSKYLSEAAEDLFYQLVKKLYEIDEIRYEHLFGDGTKFLANANKYTFVWQKSVSKNQEKLEKKASKFLEELSGRYDCPETNLEVFLNHLKSNNIEFVSGKGKKKSQIQKDIEQITEMLEKMKKYDEYNGIFRGRNSFSKTDNDATFMRMKEDHMKNGQLKPGYNVQLAIEGEYIVGTSVSSERSDTLTIIPLINKIEKNIGQQYKDVTLDAGYESEENYTYFEQKGQTCYIKPLNYERSKTRKYQNDMTLRENMKYDPENDEYTCENDKKLHVVATTKRKSKSNFESEITVYECENCLDCPYKKNCTKAKGNRQLHISKKFIEQRQKSLENITSEQGILLRMNRSIQAEGAFGIIKKDSGFTQFVLRGIKKVKTEILIIATAFNINKLHNKIQKNRVGSLLFTKLQI